jgi:hypothetical protein
MSDPGLCCAQEYRKLRSAFQSGGIIESEVRRSAVELSCLRSGHMELVPEAFLPTGIALGCPLPDAGLTEQIWQLTCEFGSNIQAMVCCNEDAIAIVPKEHYHVTIVNSRHFDVDDKKEVVGISSEQMQMAERAMRKLECQEIRIMFCGLIFTAKGRLIVPGYPIGDDLFLLRHALDQMPNGLFTANLPKTAHLKTAHLLKPFCRDQVEQVSEMTKRLGRYINVEVAFNDTFSPQGRIRLRGGNCDQYMAYT